MKRFIPQFLMILGAVFCVSLCGSPEVIHQYSEQDTAYVDSVVHSANSIDALVATHELFKDEGNLLGQVAACRELGRAYRNASRYQEAIDIHKEGLELSQEIRDTLQEVQAMNNIGTAYRRMGMLEEAAYWHYHGLMLCEVWSDTTTVGLKNRVVSLNGLGNVHLSMGNNDVAMDSFREALKGETKLGSLKGMAINYSNIAALHERDGQIDSARYYYSLSMEVNIKSGSDLGISLCHNHFGRLSETEGDYEAAIEQYRAAYDIMKDNDDRWHWHESCLSLSRVSMKLGRMRDARHYLDEALSAAELVGSHDHLAETYDLAYVLEKSTGRHSEALYYLEKQMVSLKILMEERNDKEIFRLKSQYERQKNQNEIQILQTMHNQELRRDRIILYTFLIVIVFAVIAIVFLVYALSLRSRNNRILKELNQTKNNYFTNVAHEFRTPLTVITAAAAAIRRETPEDSPVWEDADDVLRYSESLLDLVNQVMDIARMTSDIAPEPVWHEGNILPYVSGICEQMRRWSESQGVSLEFKADCEDIIMDFIPDMVLRIVRNLISNAVKFSERGGAVEVYVSRDICRGNETVLIKVKDNGVGMTREQIEHAFQPFYQANPILIGSGVGLPVVMLSAQAMGGTVDISSAHSEGTEVDVRIPILHGNASHDKDTFGKRQYEDMGIPSVDVLETSEMSRILIVEDSPDVARWQMRQLGGGYVFYFASNGAEGLRVAEDVVPDLIISDVMMPVMDGVEMCRKIRDSEILNHIPVLMVTARTGHEEKMEGLKAGADAYLEKPYREEELAVRVKQLLEQRKKLKLCYSSKEDEIRSDTYSVAERDFLDKFNAALESAFAKGKIDCEELASELCIGRVQLNRKLKAITGYKTTEYIHALRMAKAKELLEMTSLSIGEIAMKCGIDDVGYFSTIFRKSFGVTPTAYRNG